MNSKMAFPLIRVLTFVAIFVTLVGTPLHADLRDWDYRHWNYMDRQQQLRMVEGIMLGAWAVVQDMMMVNFDDPDMVANIKTYLAPYWEVRAGDLVDFVDEMYMDTGNRSTPIYVLIALRGSLRKGESNGADRATDEEVDHEDQRAGLWSS